MIHFNSNFKFKFLLLAAALVMNVGVMKAAWSGSGSGIYKDGTYYAVYDDTERNYSIAGSGFSYTYDFNAPGANLNCSVKRSTWGATGSLYITQYNDNSKINDLYSSNPGTSYENVSDKAVDLNATKLVFSGSWGTFSRYFKNVRVTMAQYLENPSSTTVDFGDGKVDAEATQTITIPWCNVPAMTISSVSGTNAGDVTMTYDVNSEYGKYNTTTFTIKYNRKTAGSLNASFTITDTHNSYSQTITIKGSATKYDQTISWSGDKGDDYILLSDNTRTTAATASSGYTVSYESSNENYLKVDASGNLTPVAVTPTGTTVTITASQDGDYKYNAAPEQTREYTVKTKDTPKFTPSFSGTTPAMKVGETATITIEDVSTDANFSITNGNSNVISVTKNEGTINIEALNAGSATLALDQKETEGIFAKNQVYTITVNKNTPSITQGTASAAINSVLSLSSLYTTTNTELPVSVSSSDESKAKVIGDKLYVYGTTGNVTLTVSQEENYKWAKASQDFTLTIGSAPAWTWEGNDAPALGICKLYQPYQKVFLTYKSAVTADASAATLFTIENNSGSNPYIISYDNSGTKEYVQEEDGNNDWGTDWQQWDFQSNNGGYYISNTKNKSDSYERFINTDGSSVNYPRKDLVNNNRTWWIIGTDQWNGYDQYQKAANYSKATNLTQALHDELVRVMSEHGNEQQTGNYATHVTALKAINDACDAYVAAIATCDQFETDYKTKTTDQTTPATDLSNARTALATATTVEAVNAALANLKSFDVITFSPTDMESQYYEGDAITIGTDALKVTHLCSSAITYTYSNSASAQVESGVLKFLKADDDFVLTASTATSSTHYAATASKHYQINQARVTTFEIEPGYQLLHIDDNVGLLTLFKNIDNAPDLEVSFSPEGIVSYNTSTQTFTADALGNTTMTVKQAQKTGYAGATKEYGLTVSKRSNHITVTLDGQVRNSINLGQNQTISFTYNGESGASLKIDPAAGNNDAVAKIAANQIITGAQDGVCEWTITQAENDKYESATTTVRVRVNSTPEEDNYVLEDLNQEYTIGTYGTTKAFELSGPGEFFYFDAKKSTLGAQGIYAEYSVDGSKWETCDDGYISGSLSDSYKTFSKTVPETAKYVRFEAKVGATLTKYFENIKVTRKTYVRANIDGNASKDLGTVNLGSSADATISIPYSVTNGTEIRIISSLPNEFVPECSTKNVTKNSDGTLSVKVTYTPVADHTGSRSATITVENDYYTAQVTMTAKGIATRYSKITAAASANGLIYATMGETTPGDDDYKSSMEESAQDETDALSVAKVGKFYAKPNTGYHLTAWYSDATYQNQVSESLTISESFSEESVDADAPTTVSRYALFAANTYTASFYYNDGTEDKTDVTETYDANYVLPASEPTRTGYTFAGWYTMAEGGTQVTTSDKYTTADNSSVYAHWTINTYTITWKNGDETLATYNVEYGATPTYTGETPTKAEDEQYTYTFSGWDPAIESVTGEATYTAQFTATQKEKKITVYIGTSETEENQSDWETIHNSNPNAIAITDDADWAAKHPNNVVLNEDGTYSCNTFTITDGNPLNVPVTFTAEQVTYGRSSSGSWGTVCLPFKLVSDATIQYYKLKEYKNNAMYYTPIDHVEANTPAVFKLLSGSSISMSLTDEEVVETPSTQMGSTGDASTDWTLIGTYVKKTYTPSENPDKYYIASNAFWCFTQNTKQTLNLNPFRAYFQTTAQAAPGRISINILDEMGTITSIGELNADGDIHTTTGNFSLSGQNLGKNPNVHGLYIKNGKVVFGNK